MGIRIENKLLGTSSENGVGCFMPKYLTIAKKAGIDILGGHVDEPHIATLLALLNVFNGSTMIANMIIETNLVEKEMNKHVEKMSSEITSLVRGLFYHGINKRNDGSLTHRVVNVAIEGVDLVGKTQFGHELAEHLCGINGGIDITMSQQQSTNCREWTKAALAIGLPKEFMFICAEIDRIDMILGSRQLYPKALYEKYPELVTDVIIYDRSHISNLTVHAETLGIIDGNGGNCGNCENKTLLELNRIVGELFDFKYTLFFSHTKSTDTLISKYGISNADVLAYLSGLIQLDRQADGGIKAYDPTDAVDLLIRDNKVMRAVALRDDTITFAPMCPSHTTLIPQEDGEAYKRNLFNTISECISTHHADISFHNMAVRFKGHNGNVIRDEGYSEKI